MDFLSARATEIGKGRKGSLNDLGIDLSIDLDGQFGGTCG